MDSLETRLQRRNTTAYIASDPSVVTLQYVERVSNGAGGTKAGARRPRRPQTMRLIEAVGGGEKRTYTVDGKALEANYTLLAEHDADLAEGDTFLSEDGRRFQVLFVYPDQRYKRTADAVYLG